MRKKNWIAVWVLLSLLFSLVPAYAFSFSIPEIWAAEENLEEQEPGEEAAPEEEALGENDIIVKHLIVPINFTWGQIDKDGVWYFDHGAPGERQEFSGSFDGSWLEDEYKGKLSVVSVEPYSGSNFDFEGPYDFWYNNTVVQNKDDFHEEYFNRTLSGLTITSYETDEAKVYFSYQGTLIKGDALNVMPEAALLGGSYALDEILYPRMGGGVAAKEAYPEVCAMLEKNLRGKTPDLDQSQMYCWFNPIVVTYKITQSTDLAVDKINIPSLYYPPSTAVDIYVDVSNSSEKAENTVVRLVFNGEMQDRDITLEAGESKTINFAVTTPGKDGAYTVTAEINPDRTIEEVNYENNKKSASLVVKEIKNTLAPCNKIYNWTEYEIEWVTVTVGDYESGYSEITYPVYHYFYYRAELEVIKSLVTDDRSNLNTYDWLLNDNGTVHNWIRAGYGVKVNAEARVKVEQTGGDWIRPYTATVSGPTLASVTTDWRMNNTRNLNSGQAQTINLGIDGKGSKFSNKFKTLPNAANPDKPPVIYTNLDLPDGTANMTLRVQGAYVNDQELCVNKKLGIKINGDMYDDYRIN